MNLQFFQNIWEKQKILVIGIATLLFIILLTIVGQSKMFKSSLLESENPFNGAIYPIEKSPNYLTWKGSQKADLFSSIAEKDLVKLPSYPLALQTGDSDDIKLAKLTFPVVYMGDYNGTFTENTGSHLAIDIRVPKGTPVRSIANGVVVKASSISSGFGHHICIRHRNVPDFANQSMKVNYVSCYNHLDEVKVEEGDFVMKGNIIGTSGATGTATTPHLHFQIDKDSAPWHPYWPFSSAEQYAANLSFFDAISSGLGKDKAVEYTINPLIWIANNYSEIGMSSGELVASSDNTRPVETTNSQLSSFTITADKDNIAPSESATLTISAKDNSGKILSSFSPSNNLTVSSTSSSAQFNKTLNFSSGVATLKVSNSELGDFQISVSQGEIKKSILLIVSSKDGSSTASSTTTNTTESTHAASDSIDGSAVAEVAFSGDTYTLIGNSVSIGVTLKDKIGNPIKTLKEPVSIALDGKGELTPRSISSDQLQNGKVALRYVSSVPETARIEVAGNSYKINVISEVKTIASFKVFNASESLSIGKPTKVYIQGLDSDGNTMPNYNVVGTVKVRFESDTQGTIEPAELTGDKFINGKAEISVNTSSTGTVKLIAENGGLIGRASFSMEENAEDIFTDVTPATDHATAIKYLKDHNIIGGYSDGSFHPNQEVSRIEALKMLLLGLNKGLTPAESLKFPDTDSSAWYAPYVGRGITLGMVKGYPDGSFKPSNSVNRAEYYKILMTAAYGSIPASSDSPFVDVPAGNWFTDAVSFAKSKGITDASTNFLPSGNVSRAEVAETLYRVLTK